MAVNIVEYGFGSGGNVKCVTKSEKRSGKQVEKSFVFQFDLYYTLFFDLYDIASTTPCD